MQIAWFAQITTKWILIDTLKLISHKIIKVVYDIIDFDFEIVYVSVYFIQISLSSVDVSTNETS